MKTLLLIASTLALCAGTSIAQHDDGYTLPPGVERWGELPPAQRLEAWAIPDSVTAIMTARELVDACLAYPGRMGYTATNFPIRTFREATLASMDANTELIGRPDGVAALLDAYRSHFEEDGRGSRSRLNRAERNFTSGFLELLLVQDAVLGRLSPDDVLELLTLSAKDRFSASSNPRPIRRERDYFSCKLLLLQDWERYGPMMASVQGLDSYLQGTGVHTAAIAEAVEAMMADFRSEQIRTHPGRILSNPEYYQMDDLQQASQRILADALREGIDPDATPRYAGDVGGDTISVIQLHTGKFYPDFSVQPFVEQLEPADGDPGRESLAILVVDRALTIRETADLFASGVRICERLVGGPQGKHTAGFVVRATREPLLGLLRQPYHRWLGEYGPERKLYPDARLSSLGVYTIVPFHDQVHAAYLDDLAGIGAELTGRSAPEKRIRVRASPEQLSAILELLWVRTALPVELDQPE